MLKYLREAVSRLFDPSLRPWTIPNAITGFGMFLALAHAWAYLHHRDQLVLPLFIAAAMTDPADGYLARKLNQISRFGMFLDPLRDRVIGIVALGKIGRRREVIVMLVLSAALLATTTAWYMWWGGWCWGLRLFTPAIPLLAVTAGMGVDRLREARRRWIPAALVVFGFVWALPGAMIDINGGYGALADRDAWQLAALPPYSAWQFLQHVRPMTSTDAEAVDILWVRLARETGNWSLLVPVLLLAASAVLIARAFRGLGRL